MIVSITIIHRLVIGIYLRDTATGRAVSDLTTDFFKDGKKVDFQFRGEGVFILLGEEQINFHLEIRTKDYIPHHLDIDFEVVSTKLPLLSVQLVPNQGYSSQWKAFDVDGTDSAVVALDGVQLGTTPCYIQDFDQRKRLITLTNPNRLQLDRNWYALVNGEKETYEVFEIEKKISNQVFKVKKAFENPFESHFSICPLVFGWVGEGAYHFTARDEQSHAKWMLRYTLDTGVRFETIDFRLEKEKSEEESE